MPNYYVFHECTRYPGCVVGATEVENQPNPLVAMLTCLHGSVVPLCLGKVRCGHFITCWWRVFNSGGEGEYGMVPKHLEIYAVKCDEINSPEP